MTISKQATVAGCCGRAVVDISTTLSGYVIDWGDDRAVDLAARSNGYGKITGARIAGIIRNIHPDGGGTNREGGAGRLRVGLGSNTSAIVGGRC